MKKSSKVLGIAVLLFTMFSFLHEKEVNAWGCGIPGVSEQLILHHDLAVVGTIEKIKKGGSGKYYRCEGDLTYVLFKVENSFKGETPKEFVIHWYDDSYENQYELAEGDSYLVYLNEKNGKYSTDDFSAYAERNPSDEVIKELTRSHKVYPPTKEEVSEFTYFFTTLPLKGLWTVLGVIVVMCLTTLLAMKADESDQKKKGGKDDEKNQ